MRHTLNTQIPMFHFSFLFMNSIARAVTHHGQTDIYPLERNEKPGSSSSWKGLHEENLWKHFFEDSFFYYWWHS